ncbi:MAG: VOC family protein [Chloroflexi bacterium]|nr:VOC family protein [Chloroflexota bacterium]
MPTDIGYVHHVGHVVRDMEQALHVYARLGFTFSRPAYPTVARTPGDQPRPFGAANAHAEFARNFLEVMTVVTDTSRVPTQARLVELQIPPAARQHVLENIEQTVARIAVRLARFEGLHRLVFQSASLEATAARFDHNGVGHSGINVVQQELETPSGVRLVAVRVLELDSDDVAEGQLAVAGPPEFGAAPLHPNGAVGLVDAVLCVANRDIEAFVARYSRYLGHDARRADSAWIFELQHSRLTLLPVSALDTSLPGEVAPVLPRLVGYAVAVGDLGQTRELLEGHGVPLRHTPGGDLFVPAAFALGASVIFRQKRSDA